MSLRLVLDTNIRISSLITEKGVCARMIAGVRSAQHIQIISTVVLEELRNTLNAKFRWPARAIETALQSTREMTELTVRT